MTFDLVTVPCLSDNYAFLLHDAASGHTLLVDVPEAAPILAELADRNWQVSHVLLTHHHPDHVQGLAQLRAALRARAIGVRPTPTGCRLWMWRCTKEIYLPLLGKSQRFTMSLGTLWVTSQCTFRFQALLSPQTA